MEAEGGEIVINEALVVSSAEPANTVKHFATRANACMVQDLI